MNKVLTNEKGRYILNETSEDGLKFNFDFTGKIDMSDVSRYTEKQLSMDIGSSYSGDIVYIDLSIQDGEVSGDAVWRFFSVAKLNKDEVADKIIEVFSENPNWQDVSDIEIKINRRRR